ncbi:MAG: hypothetical protein ACJ71T_06070 [Actinomycetales bacterium]
MQEHQLPQQTPEPASGAQERVEQHQKTLAIRIEEGLHAQLRFIAQLSGSSISDEIRTAIQNRITAAQEDPELIAKAQATRDDIEREAAARSAAIAGFIGTTAGGAAASRTARARRGRNPADA